MRKMLRLKQRMALVLSAAMVLSAPSMQTFSKTDGHQDFKH